MRTATITHVRTAAPDADGRTVHHLVLSSGLTGSIADASHRVGLPPGRAFACVTLVLDGRHGLAAMPVDWNPRIGDAVPIPYHWGVPI